MDTSDITPRQKSVLDFIIAYQQAHHIAPTVREIAAHLGLQSPGGIHRILNVLKERGCILAEPGRKRAWRFAGELPGRGVPLVGAIAAGVPIEAIRNIDQELKVDPALFGCDRCFGVRVRGDSMTGVHIADGDIAIIRPQPQVENQQIAAVLVQGMLTEATLKIVRRSRATLTLASANPAYHALIFRGRMREKIAILGKCVGVVRKI